MDLNTFWTFEVISQIYVKKKLFEQYLRSFVSIAKALYEEDNHAYQQLFTVKLHTFLTEGDVYVRKIIEALKKTDNSIGLEWYQRVFSAINEIKEQYTDEEFYFLEYRRHNICHLFQEGYDLVQEKTGKFKEIRQVTNKNGERKSINLEHLTDMFGEIVIEYGNGNPLQGDDNFDRAKIKLIFPIIEKLVEDLAIIHNKEIQENQRTAE